MLGTLKINIDTFLKDAYNPDGKAEYDLKKVDLKHVIENTRGTNGALHTLESIGQPLIQDLLEETKDCKNFFYFDNDVIDLMQETQEEKFIELKQKMERLKKREHNFEPVTKEGELNSIIENDNKFPEESVSV